ncbi:pleiotropic regulatory protein RsmS [Serratia symbiotica]|nr:pleiotropic regulatory protein RsmS [Serratia symbiotica]
MSLENASPILQLAIDLIYPLECNEIDPATVLAALDIVKQDYQEKLQHTNTNSSYLAYELDDDRPP